MIKLFIFFSILPLISSNHHLRSLPSIEIDPTNYANSDLIIHKFASFKSFRCLLQTESKYFYLDSSCQLLTRTSLTTICPLNYTLKLEVVS
ncbi:unnamed protein product, partial [Adineta ricciae]